MAQARAGQQQSQISLNGTVVASRRALVASELAGIVARLHVRAGERVEAGQALAELRRKPLELLLDAARGELEEAEARSHSAGLRLERLRSLSDSAVVSRQNVDDALYETQAAEARVSRLEADVERLEDELARATVRAPFAGAVVAEHTQVGQWLDPGDAVVELVSLVDLEIELDVPEDRFAVVTPGTRAVVQGNGGELRGEVRAIVPAATESARTFPAYVRLLEDSRLGVGASVRTTLHLGTPRQGVWVPRDAVVERGGQSVVFKVEGDSTATAVAIEILAGRGDWQAVQGELSAGDPVVIEGNEALVEGALVSAESQEYPWP